jgi:hypothetical protein
MRIAASPSTLGLDAAESWAKAGRAQIMIMGKSMKTIIFFIFFSRMLYRFSSNAPFFALDYPLKRCELTISEFRAPSIIKLKKGNFL